MLFLIATPIGNLADISFRAVETLKACDLVLCEDTRHSTILLKHYNIQTPLSSYHRFNEQEKLKKLLNHLGQGKKIALISDAGTPLVSDPGHALVDACLQARLPVTALPGACSPIAALLLSGFEASKFQFIGFLPRETSLKRKALCQALYFRGTTIAFESPRRLSNTLERFQELDSARMLAVVRELTKIHEECLRGTATELLEHFKTAFPRGEITLLISEGKTAEIEMDILELVELLQELHGIPLKEAIRLAAQFQGVAKKEIYQQVHQIC